MKPLVLLTVFLLVSASSAFSAEQLDCVGHFGSMSNTVALQPGPFGVVETTAAGYDFKAIAPDGTGEIKMLIIKPADASGVRIQIDATQTKPPVGAKPVELGVSEGNSRVALLCRIK